jgi:hypothetical protein
MSSKEMMSIMWLSKAWPLHLPMVEMTSSAVKSPHMLVEGGRERPHWMDWVPEFGGDKQGSNEAWFIGEASDGG